jgi:hypothetical protein
VYPPGNTPVRFLLTGVSRDSPNLGGSQQNSTSAIFDFGNFCSTKCSSKSLSFSHFNRFRYVKRSLATRFDDSRRSLSNLAEVSGIRPRTRQGVIILEFILVMPIIFITFLAIFEFAFLGLIIQAGTTAAIEGARAGALQYAAALPFNNNGAGTDPTGDNDIADKIALCVDAHLSVHGLEVRANGVSDDANKANVRVEIERGANTVTRGDTTITCNRVGTAPAATEIVVTVCFNLVDPTNPQGSGNPVPNWLNSFGIDLLAKRFQVSARATLE